MMPKIFTKIPEWTEPQSLRNVQSEDMCLLCPETKIPRKETQTHCPSTKDITSLELLRNLQKPVQITQSLANMPSAGKRCNYILLSKVIYLELLKDFYSHKKIIIFKSFDFIFGHRNKTYASSKAFFLILINTHIIY